MRFKVSVAIEKDEDGYYAWCPDLEGCHSQGDTFEEIVANIKEAIESYIEASTPKERELYRQKEVFTTAIEVDVA